MSVNYPISQLEVIGYADRLAAGGVPRKVAPIFAVRGAPATVLFPPLRVEDATVVAAQPGNQADMDRAVAAGQATRLDRPLAAVASGVLWIDQDLRPHYGPQRQVLAELQEAARRKYAEAKVALRAGRLDEAAAAARWAFAADERRWEALAVQVAVARAQGRDARGPRLLAARLADPDDFEAMVGRSVAEARVTEFPAVGRVRSA